MPLDRLGLLPLTLLDFPQEVAATLFTYGCNLRCPYCHNANLVVGGAPEDFLPRGEVLAYLEKRRKVLSGVCLTGGEPLMHPDLRVLIREIRTRGYKVKLDTNGGFPDRLRALLEEGLLDYVALDVKMAPERYVELGGRPEESERLLESIAILSKAETRVEFRTTVVPGLVDMGEVGRIVALLPAGARYSLAAFRGGSTLDPSYAEVTSPSLEELEALGAIADAAGLECSLRAAGAAAV